MAFTPTSVLRKHINDKVDRNMSDSHQLKQMIDSIQPNNEQSRQQFSSNQPTMRAIVKNSKCTLCIRNKMTKQFLAFLPVSLSIMQVKFEMFFCISVCLFAYLLMLSKTTPQLRQVGCHSI